MAFQLFLLLEAFLMLLPSSFRKVFFSLLASLAYHISSRYRKIADNNLDFVFDNKMDKKTKDEIIRYSFKNLLFNFMHLIEIRRMSKDDLLSKINVQNINVVNKANQENRAIIFVTPHYCAWELGSIAVGLVDKPLNAVFKKLKNLEYQEWMLESRNIFGNKSLEKSNVLKSLIKLIRDKRSIGIVIDSSMNKREGLEVNFLGKKTRQTATPAYLARKYNACIIPVTIRTDNENNYTLMFFDEIIVENTQDEKNDILKATQAQADWLTSVIKKEPKFWFWIHRRWKHEHPEIYKK
ncbi:MAG: lipid A biosynthesis acyltransferase [Sulfurimonas sp.]|nr:MAG: lipid A biosynthesis acyltransferase [Sulfurimonas sp.]